MAGITGPRQRALLLSGTGRYADPWHPFAETSRALAGLLGEAGFDVEIPADVDAALALLGRTDEADLPALLAVNVGLPRDGLPSPGTPEAAAGLTRWLDSGLPLWVSHSSSTSFLELPAWEEGLGGRWIRGRSMHPDYGLARISVRQGFGPVDGVPDFELMDERYSYLRTSPRVTVHATHLHDGVEHPVLWSLERVSGNGESSGRTFYDALGHDAASYESPEHRDVVLRAAAWLSERKLLTSSEP
jgi:type 1 glutamine amidotransferase